MPHIESKLNPRDPAIGGTPRWFYLDGTFPE